MKKIILFFSLLLIVLSCGTEKRTPQEENVEETILTLERHALDSWAKGDPLAYAGNFADDATYFDNMTGTRLNGIEEIKTYMGTLEGNIPPHSYELVDPKVQVYGDIAILTLQYHSTLNGEPGPPWKATSVYHLNDSVWQVVHAHWSFLKEE